MSSGAIPVSKFSACYQAILQGTEKPQPYSKQDPERFYSDLFCLRVDSNALKGLSDAVKDEQLADSGTVKVRGRAGQREFHYVLYIGCR